MVDTHECDEELKTCQFLFDKVEFSFQIHSSETIISENVEHTGAWEQNQLCLYRTFIPDNGTLVDIGANVGVNALFAQKRIPSAKVIAVEASPGNFDVLQKNIEGTMIESHKLAIADYDGSIQFGGIGTNAHIAESGGVTVDCQTLDSFTDSLVSIDLLKIDVEGYTDLVLTEASRTQKKTRRAIIEFSIEDVKSRFACDIDGVADHFAKLWEKLDFPHIYYISRNDGLVCLNNISDLIELLKIEHNVGDLLFCREEEPHTITVAGFALRRVQELMSQNHFRITEIQRLDEKLK